ncbi:hypothetical protein [Tenacibaculum xiamenense]|uniref:hypothetical protein n=1 Tax=Tenacibaculum xiamenense TaxID=1261553 RepID=UPI003893C0C5
MLENLTGVKKLSKEELKATNGGILDTPESFCNVWASAGAHADGVSGGYLDDDVTMETVFQQHYSDCMGSL